MQIAKVDYRIVTLGGLPSDSKYTEYFSSLEAARNFLLNDKLGYKQKYSDRLDANSNDSEHETWVTDFQKDYELITGKEYQFQYEARITVYNTVA